MAKGPELAVRQLAADESPASDAGSGSGGRHHLGQPEPTLPVAAVARRLGVAPATLRTWDRRYGVGPSGHTDGKHRRYSPLDVARLETMQRALLAGASTAEAARYARDTVDGDEQGLSDGSLVVPDQGTAQAEPLTRDVGGSRLARRLSAATLAMDPRLVRQLLGEAIAVDGAALAWEMVIDPVLSAIRGGWRDEHARPESAHLLRELTLSALISATPVLRRPRNHHPVLLATSSVPASEQPSLALHALAAALADRHIEPVTFGAAMPDEVLVAAVRRTVPAAVVLWAHKAPTAKPAVFSRLARGRQRSRLFACGPGWEAASLPPTVERLAAVPAAADRICYVLTGHA